MGHCARPARSYGAAQQKREHSENGAATPARTLAQAAGRGAAAVDKPCDTRLLPPPGGGRSIAFAQRKRSGGGELLLHRNSPHPAAFGGDPPPPGGNYVLD